VHVTDGIKFVGDTEEGTYDAIIVDSSDPVGPAAVLFERAFFEKIHRALKPGGVVCTQGECIWLHAELIKDVLEMCKDIFTGGSVQYGFTTIPTYPSGQIGFVMACKPDENGKTATFVKPERPPPVAPGACFVLRTLFFTAFLFFQTPRVSSSDKPYTPPFERDTPRVTPCPPSRDELKYLKV
jgi:spermidine synthase